MTSTKLVVYCGYAACGAILSMALYAWFTP